MLQPGAGRLLRERREGRLGCSLEGRGAHKAEEERARQAVEGQQRHPGLKARRMWESARQCLWGPRAHRGKQLDVKLHSEGPQGLEDDGLDAGGRWWAWRRERGRVELAKASEQGKDACGFYWRFTAFSSKGTQRPSMAQVS